MVEKNKKQIAFEKNRQSFMESVKHLNAFIIEVDGKTREVEPKNGEKFTLEELHENIGTENIEFLSTHDGNYIIVDEEARLHTVLPPVNVRASLLFKFGYRVQILGKAMFCKANLL